MINTTEDVPGRVPKLDHPRRRPSNATLNRTVSRQGSSNSTYKLRKDSGLNHRAPATLMGSRSPQTAPVPPTTRGKLPWLKGTPDKAGPSRKSKLPGSWTDSSPSSHDSPVADLPDIPHRRSKASISVPAENPILQSDPSIRPNASMRSMRKTNPKPTYRKYSLTSTPDFPAIRAMRSQGSIPKIPDSRRPSKASYTPSTYSSSLPSEDKHIVGQNVSDAAAAAIVERVMTAEVTTSPPLRRPRVPQRLASLERAGEMYSVRSPTLPLMRPSDTSLLGRDPKVERQKASEMYSVRAPPRSPGRRSMQISPPPLVIRSDQAAPPLRDISPKTPIAGHPPWALSEAETAPMERAMTGLEAVMQEALGVAKEAIDRDRPEDVAAILDEANLTLKNAATVRGYMISPLRLSESDIGMSDDESGISDSGSDISSLHSEDRHSDDTAPTVLTKSMRSSKQPIISEPYFEDGHIPRSEEVEIDLGRPPNGRLTRHSSISPTPPRLYEPPSVESIVRDFAYNGPPPRHASIRRSRSEESPRLGLPSALARPQADRVHPVDRSRSVNLAHIEPSPTNTTLSPQGRSVSRSYERVGDEGPRRRRKSHHANHPHAEKMFESSYYRVPEKHVDATDLQQDVDRDRYESLPSLITPKLSLRHPRRNHISLRENQHFRLRRHRHQPVAREWKTGRKRITATIACFNTGLVGLLIGIYAGEVPRIQYQIADQHHNVILGNVVLYIGLAITTLLAWPLPLLHGRKPYTLAALALALPLQFPQAIAIQSYRANESPSYRVGLLLPRALTGLALGFANVNALTTLFDLFGVSLMSSKPHQELVVTDDVRRQGGGMGLWLGIWAWCFIGSLAVGFSIGAGIIAHLNASWGFYITVILLAFFLLLNVIAPETRRNAHRRSILQYFDHEEKLKRRVARGEVKLHISQDGPKWWWEEVGAGVKLMWRMLLQPGLFVLVTYLGWIYAEVVLVTLLLGALLSRDYVWRPQYVGLAVLSVAFGALLAVPLAKAGLFSRSRITPPRTDSMTFQPRVTWTSHLLRRCIFTLILPFAGLAYTLASPGPQVTWVVPALMSLLVGFLSNLAVAECVGLIMEAFDTSDLQPGVNSKHRLQSMASTTRRRRTNYSSFPRVSAGVFLAQGIGFFLAAAATAVSGDITRALGAQATTGVVAGILLFITILLTLVLWRWKTVQVIPNGAFGTMGGSVAWNAADVDEYWKPVIIGNPSGKTRRMNLVELGGLSRWTEIRRLNKLVRD